jgi:hypothetical protein
VSYAPAPLLSGRLALAVSDRLTVIELGPPPTGASGSTNAAPRGGVGNRAPRLERLRLRRRVHVQRRALTADGRRTVRQPRVSLVHVLSEPATLRVVVERVRPRRRVGVMRSRRGAGRGSTTLRRRIVRRLQPGRYRIRLTAVDGQGARSRERFVTLRVVRR